RPVPHPPHHMLPKPTASWLTTALPKTHYLPPPQRLPPTSSPESAYGSRTESDNNNNTIIEYIYEM
ncbi:hypothetical protein A2U01_0113643, partial [Trifolium medium]|nr:hypothetical protein [Trifolium medium]